MLHCVRDMIKTFAALLNNFEKLEGCISFLLLIRVNSRIITELSVYGALKNLVCFSMLD